MTARSSPPMLIACRSAFEAQAVLTTLTAAGVEAAVMETLEAIPIEPGGVAPTYVVANDRAQAEAALAAAADIDWSAVDVGVREDDVPLTPPGRMPWLARVAFGAAIAVVLLGVGGAVAMVVVSWLGRS